MPTLSPVAPTAAESPNVVVLCAEEELRDVIGYWFASLSIPTLATTNGYVANRILKSMTGGLLITDRTLPPWPGLDTFRQLLSANPQLRIAFIEDGSHDGAILARVAGATLVLARPLARQRVVEALGLPGLLT